MGCVGVGVGMGVGVGVCNCVSLTGLPREGRKPVRDATYAEVGFVRGQILAHITLKRNMRPSH